MRHVGLSCPRGDMWFVDWSASLDFIMDPDLLMGLAAGGSLEMGTYDRRAAVDLLLGGICYGILSSAGTFGVLCFFLMSPRI